MNAPMSNIEAVAREICSQQMAGTGLRDAELDAVVGLYWHCVAAQLESGQIDETGNPVTPFDFDKSLGAYRDWCSRHPEGKPR